MNWRRWVWIQKFALWLLGESILLVDKGPVRVRRHVANRPWFSEVSQLVQQAGRKKYTGKQKRQWVLDSLLTNYGRRSQWPPHLEEVDRAIQLLVEDM